MHRRLLIPFLTLAVCALGCSDDTTSVADDIDPPSTTTTAEAPTDTEAPSEPGPAEPSTDEAEPLVGLAWLDDPTNNYVVVDTRSPDAFLTGHIPGARNLPATAFNARGGEIPYQLGSAEAAAEVLSAAGIEPDDTLVLYDNEGSLNAARAYYALTYYGHEHQRILDGGLSAWLGDDRPSAVDPPAEFEAVDYPTQPVRDELRLELPDVSDALAQGDATFADARTSSEYDGSLALDTEFNGHIPGAANVDHAATIDADGRFLSAGELQALYSAAGIEPESSVVTYCLVGARAAHSWFVLSELLDYPAVALYDGSWVEYGNTPGLDVET